MPQDDADKALAAIYTAIAPRWPGLTARQEPERHKPAFWWTTDLEPWKCASAQAGAAAASTGRGDHE